MTNSNLHSTINYYPTVKITPQDSSRIKELTSSLTVGVDETAIVVGTLKIPDRDEFVLQVDGNLVVLG